MKGQREPPSTKRMATVHFENASDSDSVPAEQDFERWVEAALKAINLSADSELSIRIVSSQESQALNSQYRNKDKPTNVLSFPCELPEGIDIPLLGDLAICASLVQEEALEQHKSDTAHWAHLVVHGTLHLCGYDHIDDTEAEEMEALEILILKTLGFKNPYLLTNDQSPSEMELNDPHV